jgi:hypothetical protein
LLSVRAMGADQKNAALAAMIALNDVSTQFANGVQ